jgi:poly-gamma-glutamate synthesis protein (capsule biosynthesis protein)
MSLTVMLGGDVHVTGRAKPAQALEGLRPILDRADVRIVNMEGLLVEPSSTGAAPDIPHKANWRHPGPQMIDALVAAGIDAVSCANNVSYPPQPLLESIAALDEVGIGHAGGGNDTADAHAPHILNRAGTKVGLLAYSSVVFPYGHAATEHSPGIAPLRADTAYKPDPRSAEVPGRSPIVWTVPVREDLDRMIADVEAARQRCDFLVVSVHWGLPGTALCDYQPVAARAAIDAGADVIMGHGPHSVHGVDLYRGRPILYSLGNLAFDWVPMRGRYRDGLLALCHLGGNRLTHVTLLPVRRDDANDIRLADPDDRTTLDVVEKLSSRVAQHLRRLTGELELLLPCSES